MTLRSLSDRARIESAQVLRKVLSGLLSRGGLTRPDLYVVRTSPPERDDADTTSSRSLDSQTKQAESPDRDGTASDSALADPGGRDVDLMKAMDRISDAIDRLAIQLDAYHDARTEHWDAIELLLREMAISAIPAAQPIIHGGVIDPDTIDLAGHEPVVGRYLLQAGTPVEVRSRLQDRWVCGFVIAQAVEGPGPCRYRLTRRSDGLALPILFDVCDIRTSTRTLSPQRSSD
jgi:hypothetical protein